MKYLISGVAMAALSFACAVTARDGDPDTSFNGTGRATFAIDQGGPLTDLGIGTMPLSDGKLLVVGTITPAGPDGARIACVRLLANGTRDLTYGPEGERYLDTAYNSGSPGFVSAFGDSFLLWGTRNYPFNLDGTPAPTSIDGNTGNTDVLLHQVRTDCTTDTTFGDAGTKRIPFDFSGSGLQDIATAAFIGDVPVRIFVAAAIDASAQPGDRDFGVAVLTLSGQLDTSFSTDGKARAFFDLGGPSLDVPTSIYARNGIVMMTGYARKVADGTHDLAIARMTSTGQPDPTFCPDIGTCPDSPVQGGKRTFGYESPSATNESNVIGHIGFDGAVYTASTTTVVSPPGNEQLMLAKFNANGSVSSWSGGSGRVVGSLLTNTRPVFVNLTGSGLVVAGSTAANAFNVTDSQSRMFIARFGPSNGQGDLGFVSTNNCVLTFCGTYAFPGSTGQPTDARAVHVREIDGKYVMTGYALFSAASGLDYDFAVARTQGQFIFSNSFE